MIARSTLDVPPITTTPRTPRLGAGRLQVLGPIRPRYDEVLTPGALEFLQALASEFEPRRHDILTRRMNRLAGLQAGDLPDFVAPAAGALHANWKAAPIPPELADRRVEITGPVERKMIINALNSGASCFMADFEDSTSPTWDNLIAGHVNLRDAVRRTIQYISPEGKTYRLNEKTAVLLVRPRGWHLDDKHILLDGRRISGSLMDFGLFFYHNARELLERGSGPWFYLPKLESYLEARLWNDVFGFAQDRLGIPRGTIRATVLIETILAAFEQEAILWELRDHSSGLNCGRWDYIFSVIKKFAHDPRFLMPDRAQVTMSTPFMRNYSLLTIQTCHRRGVHAMGGMAAQIPIKDDPAANALALEKVRADKRREVGDGHDGTWVAHPGLVPVALEEFAPMTGPNQIDRLRNDVTLAARDLLPLQGIAGAGVSEQGIRTNIEVGVRYLESWLRGNGCVPINNLMEDAATAEISRAQLWQWVHLGAPMTDGRHVSLGIVEAIMQEEMAGLRQKLGPEHFDRGRFGLASHLFLRMTQSPVFPEFLTVEAYEYL